MNSPKTKEAIIKLGKDDTKVAIEDDNVIVGTVACPWETGFYTPKRDARKLAITILLMTGGNPSATEIEAVRQEAKL